MSEMLLDYKASVPKSVPALPVMVIPAAPGIQVADVGLYVTPPVPVPNRVELKTTVGVNALADSPIISVRIDRFLDGVGPAFNVVSGLQRLNLAGGQLYLLTLQGIDYNVQPSTGFVVYRVIVQSINPATSTATVVGPVTFSAAAFGPID